MSHWYGVCGGKNGIMRTFVILVCVTCSCLDCFNFTCSSQLFFFFIITFKNGAIVFVIYEQVFVYLQPNFFYLTVGLCCLRSKFGSVFCLRWKIGLVFFAYGSPVWKFGLFFCLRLHPSGNWVWFFFFFVRFPHHK